MNQQSRSKRENMKVHNANGKWRKSLRVLLGIFIYLCVLPLLLFAIVFVIVPVVFKYSPGIQRSIILPTWVIPSQNYSDAQSLTLPGVRNFYLNVNQQENVSLGIWQILPQSMLSEFIDNQNYNFEGALDNANYKILLYLHGNGSDRTMAKELFEILRQFFHIFSVDYRGYADSSKGQMTETAMVQDIQEVYNWLRNNSNSSIYVWGHSLGTSISSHLVSSLKKSNASQPLGVILETPFTSVVDIMLLHPFIKIMCWFPWCNATFLQPVIDNDLNFSVQNFIDDIDCPIMMLHAKDDTIIPYQNADKLYEYAMNRRNLTYQGNITYHLFDVHGYDHMWLFAAPELPSYVRSFINKTEVFHAIK